MVVGFTVTLEIVSVLVPVFVSVTVCGALFWPTCTLPKLTTEGFDVSCPEPANADEVSARIAEKMKNTRNPDEIPLHDETCFTMLPLNGALKLRDRGIRAAACRT